MPANKENPGTGMPFYPSGMMQQQPLSNKNYRLPDQVSAFKAVIKVDPEFSSPSGTRRINALSRASRDKAIKVKQHGSSKGTLF
jgi:hypothetical protein